MPNALVFTIQPTTAATLPHSMGRAAHAAILDLLGLSDPGLPDSLHAPAAIRPLTVSNLLGRTNAAPSSRVLPNERYRLRVTMLSAALEAIGESWLLHPPTYLVLGEIAWRVLSVTADQGRDSWAGQTSYAELAAQALNKPQRVGGRWQFEFHAPVTFRRRGTCVPLPTPGLVFGSLFDKWNALSGFPLPDRLRDRFEEDILVSDFNLCSATALTKNNIVQIGAVGTCTYHMRRELAAYQSALDMLAQFAFYSGVGAATTRGFGQVRLLNQAKATSKPSEAAHVSAN
jgi:CRISPR-associated endoribonuclease Cas6